MFFLGGEVFWLRGRWMRRAGGAGCSDSRMQEALSILRFGCGSGRSRHLIRPGLRQKLKGAAWLRPWVFSRILRASSILPKSQPAPPARLIQLFFSGVIF